jgi:hypothetical protein
MPYVQSIRPTCRVKPSRSKVETDLRNAAFLAAVQLHLDVDPPALADLVADLVARPIPRGRAAGPALIAMTRSDVSLFRTVYRLGV